MLLYILTHLTIAPGKAILRAVSELPHRKPIYRRVSVLLPIAVLLLAALAGFALADNAYNRGITYSPPLIPIAWADVPQLGVNAYNIQFEPNRDNVTRTLEMARELGAHYVRMQLPWEDVEIHAKGDFEDRRNAPAHSAWEKYDFIFGEMRRLGLEPIVRIDRPPDWARARAKETPEFKARLAINSNAIGPPDNYADYADFVGAVTARYREQVRFIQIWNEPNLTDEWNGQTPSPAQFVELLKAGYTRAKTVNPAVVVLFPSLAPTDGLDLTAPLTDLEFLDQVYALGGGQYFDIMSAQAYGLGQPPDEHRYIRLRRPGDWSWRQPIDTRIDVSRLVLVREVMERHGDAAKAIWISEFGYVTDSPFVPLAKRSTWGVPVSEQQKAEYLVGQLERARREWPWVGVMNVWFLRWGGEAPNPADPTPNFALIDRDFRPLPAYDTIKAYAAQGAIAGVGAHSWEHPAVGPGRAPNRWSLRFEGSSLALVGMPGPMEIALDGKAPLQVNPDVEGGPVTIASGLSDSVHTVVLSGTNGPPRLFVVARAQPLPWLWTIVPALLLAALTLTGGLIMRAFSK
jgi:hypothetical protein